MGAQNIDESKHNLTELKKTIAPEDLTEKASPVSADIIIIEDSQDQGEKKKVQIGNLLGGGGGVWGSITGTLSNQIDLDAALDGKSDSGHNHALNNLSEKSYNSLTDKPTSFPPSSHNNSAHSETYITQAAITTHEGAADPHTGYQKESEKGAASGYASLDAGAKVPTAELGGAGADATKFLRGDQTWQVPGGGGAHDLGGASHNADTLANLNAKISDADVIALAGQIGGTAASPDVRGLRESGGQLLTMGVVADGQYLLRSGTNIISGSPGGGSTPAWKGNIAAAWGDGDPAPALRHMSAAGVISPTPTNISVTVARCAFFKLDTQLVVNKIRWYGVGATTGKYRVAVYDVATLARIAVLNDFNTAAATWGNGAFSCTLSANTLYIIAVAVNTTGTTAGILALGPTTAATTGVMVLPTNWPGNLDFNAASPKVAPFGFCQFAVTSGALPATLPTLVNQAAWTGGMPAFFLDNNNA